MPKTPELIFEIEPTKEREKMSDIVKYWKNLDFPATPPKPGTPVEQRMLDIAREYYDIALMCAKNGNPPGSSAKRRELHNQLALMIYGQQRSDLDTRTAEKIADFASYVTNGSDLNTAINDTLNYEKNEKYN